MEPFTLWFTGIPASGKTTLGDKIADRLRPMGLKIQTLDGDETRRYLSPDLGFSREDRRAHLYKVVYLTRMLNLQGVNVLVSSVSPYLEDRKYAKQMIDEFIEIYVDCPVEVCIQRDPKGLYRRAIDGQISGVTGFDAPYEVPENPDLVISTNYFEPDVCIEKIVNYLTEFGYLGSAKDDTELLGRLKSLGYID